MSNLIVQDINHLERDQSEVAHIGNAAEYSLSLGDHEKAKLLATAGFEAARIHPERVSLNRLIYSLASDGNGKRNAHSLIMHARSVGEPLESETLATNVHGEALDPWLAVQRPRVEILGAVLVMPNVTVTDHLDNVLVDNGTSVDVLRADDSVDGLVKLAESGKSVAEEITQDGRNIFMLEAVSPPVTIDENSKRTMSVIKKISKKLLLSELSYDPEIIKELGAVFDSVSNPAYMNRDDILGNKPSFGRVLSTKPIDNTISNR